MKWSESTSGAVQVAYGEEHTYAIFPPLGLPGFTATLIRDDDASSAWECKSATKEGAIRAAEDMALYIEMSLKVVKAAVQAFSKARDWHRFHTPRNLAAQLSVEAGELLECYAWSENGKSTRGDVRAELADVLIYLVMLADAEGVDMIAAALDKINDNARRYPVEASRGRADKAPGEG